MFGIKIKKGLRKSSWFLVLIGPFNGIVGLWASIGIAEGNPVAIPIILLIAGLFAALVTGLSHVIEKDVIIKEK